MDLCAAVACLGVFILICIILGLVFIILTSSKPNMERHEEEKYFINPRLNGAKQPFPSIHDQATVDLSVIVPSYNEETRLPKMLDEAVEYLEDRMKNNPKFTYEVIVVDDGSMDKTSEVALQYSEKYSADRVRVLTQVRNRGKGGAIRLGMFSARGKYLLFADADGATKFSDVSKLETEMNRITEKEHYAVVCGSRAHLEKESIAERSFFRTVLMYGFHFLVWFLCVRGVRDTQCGFKLLTRPAAIVLFSNLHVDRWAFDVDMLYIAQCLKMHISEVAVSWQEIEGSKMVPVWSWLQMGKDLLLIRLRYVIGAWTIDRKLKTH